MRLFFKRFGFFRLVISICFYVGIRRPWSSEVMDLLKPEPSSHDTPDVVLGAELRSSARATSMLDRQAISPALHSRLIGAGADTFYSCCFYSAEGWVWANPLSLRCTLRPSNRQGLWSINYILDFASCKQFPDGQKRREHIVLKK